MAQISRAIKTLFLRTCPPALRHKLLAGFPNLRKAAPEGHQFVFDHYLSDIRVNIDTRYKVERIMWSGVYEPSLYRWLQTMNTSDWVCMDIGANVGAVTLMLAKMIGPNGQIISFEPGPPNISRLLANCALNPELESRITVVQSGVGATPAELWWSEEAGNPGNAMVSSTGTHRVPISTIDAYIQEHPLTTLDFIKIDVEGMELDVMRGAEGTLRRFHPTLYFETLPRYSKAQGGSNFEEIENLLARKHGYRLFSIGRDGSLSPISSYSRLGDYTVARYSNSGGSV